jgi:hypothetical protein
MFGRQKFRLTLLWQNIFPSTSTKQISGFDILDYVLGLKPQRYSRHMRCFFFYIQCVVSHDGNGFDFIKD